MPIMAFMNLAKRHPTNPPMRAAQRLAPALMILSVLLTGCAPAASPPTLTTTPTPLPATATPPPPTQTPAPPTATSTITPAPTATLAPGVERVLLVIFDRYEEQEYGTPRELLEAAGLVVSVASSTLEPVHGSQQDTVQPDLLLSTVNTADYAAIVFIGGYHYDQDNADAIRIAQEAVTQEKVLAAICVAPTTLIRAGVLDGKRATSSLPPSILKRAGAIYTGARVERDGLIITGSGPNAASDFGAAIVTAIQE